jgi:hypothetical protein
MRRDYLKRHGGDKAPAADDGNVSVVKTARSA